MDIDRDLIFFLDERKLFELKKVVSYSWWLWELYWWWKHNWLSCNFMVHCRFKCSLKCFIIWFHTPRCSWSTSSYNILPACLNSWMLACLNSWRKQLLSTVLSLLSFNVSFFLPPHWSHIAMHWLIFRIYLDINWIFVWMFTQQKSIAVFLLIFQVNAPNFVVNILTMIL